jgi:hypothetical protein
LQVAFCEVRNCANFADIPKQPVGKVFNLFLFAGEQQMQPVMKISIPFDSLDNFFLANVDDARE